MRRLFAYSPQILSRGFRQRAADSRSTSINNAAIPSNAAMETPTMITMDPRLMSEVNRRHIGVLTRGLRRRDVGRPQRLVCSVSDDVAA